MLSYVWIRIHKAPEFGSSTDPDPQHCQPRDNIFSRRLQIRRFVPAW